MTEHGVGQLQLVKVRTIKIAYANTQYPWLQFPVALLPLLPTDLLDNQPVQ